MWKRKALGEITSYMAKGIPPKYVINIETPDTIKVLNQKCNRNFQVSYKEARLHDNSAKKVPEDKMLRPGDILINSTGAGTAGRIAQIWNIPSPTTIDGHMILIRSTDEVDPLYFGYALKGYQSVIESFAEGSTGQTEINKTRLQNEIIISFPTDKNLQQKIGATLLNIDDKIKANEDINQNLEQQTQAIFKEKFINNYDDTWQHGTFSNIINYMINGDWGKEKLTGNYTEKVFCIRGADIPEVRNGNKGKMPIRYILPKNYLAKHLVPGDIVVEVSGGSPTQSTGRATIITDSLLNRYDRGMVCTNFCKALKPYEGYSLFAYHYWQYLYDQGIFFSYENGTTGIKNLDIAGIIENEPIIIPPKEFIVEFNNTCNTFYNKIYANSHESEQLAQLRDTLLPKLMSGELDVSSIDI